MEVLFLSPNYFVKKKILMLAEHCSFLTKQNHMLDK